MLSRVLLGSTIENMVNMMQYNVHSIHYRIKLLWLIHILFKVHLCKQITGSTKPKGKICRCLRVDKIFYSSSVLVKLSTTDTQYLEQAHARCNWHTQRRVYCILEHRELSNKSTQWTMMLLRSKPTSLCKKHQRGIVGIGALMYWVSNLSFQHKGLTRLILTTSICT